MEAVLTCGSLPAPSRLSLSVHSGSAGNSLFTPGTINLAMNSSEAPTPQQSDLALKGVVQVLRWREEGRRERGEGRGERAPTKCLCLSKLNVNVDVGPPTKPSQVLVLFQDKCDCEPHSSPFFSFFVFFLN